MEKKNELTTRKPVNLFDDLFFDFFPRRRNFLEEIDDLNKFYGEDSSWIVKKDSYEMNIPNIPEKLDKLNVSVEDNAIKIEYSYKDEHSSQSFSSYRTLPEDCDYAKISANVENNVLTVVIPKGIDKEK